MNNRPLAVTILCGFMFVQWIIGIINTVLIVIFTRITPGSQPLDPTYFYDQFSTLVVGVSLKTANVLTFIMLVAFIIGIFGYWFMHRWSLIIYAAATVVLFIFMQQGVTAWSSAALYSFIITFLVPVAFLVLGGIYFKRMK